MTRSQGSRRTPYPGQLTVDELLILIGQDIEDANSATEELRILLEQDVDFGKRLVWTQAEREVTTRYQNLLADVQILLITLGRVHRGRGPEHG